MNFDMLDELAAQLRVMRPLNETELKRLRDELSLNTPTIPTPSRAIP